MGEHRKTAAYKIASDFEGNRYKFYCDLSGAFVCITMPYKADTPEKELELAWENEGKRYFNYCNKCGKWVIDVAYNPDVFECTDCAPFENEISYCKFCGAKVNDNVRFCPACNKKLHYEGVGCRDDK